MRCHAAVLLGALALVLAGCGSSAASRSTSSGARHLTTSSPLPTTSGTGHEVFTRDCSFCHSLSGHSSPKQQGGDLLGVHLSRPVLTQATAEMPVKRPLSKSDLDEVVSYMLAVQRRSGQG